MPRRRYLVQKVYQGRFILVFLVISILGLGLALGYFTYSAEERLSRLIYSMRLPSGDAGGLFLKEVLLSHAIAFGSIVLATVAAVLYMRKKTSGPLYKLAREIVRIGDGDLTQRVGLRHGDDFAELAEHLNAMQDQLALRFNRISEALQGAAEALSRLEEKGDSKALEAAVKKMRVLREEAGRFEL